MKINKTGLFILNAILFSAIVIGHYGWIEPKTVLAVFITPAFIISASLTYGITNKRADKK